jgi:hypothetical protein
MAGRPWELSEYGQSLMDDVLNDARAVAYAEHQLHKSVIAAREQEIPWRFIGDALGITKQAAQERFSKPPAGKLV